MASRLPPTSDRLQDPDAVPYFAWDLGITVAEVKRRLAGETGRLRDEVIVRLLREANSRDVWLFVGLDEIEEAWPRVERHLGRARPVWNLLLSRRGELSGATPT